MTTLADLKNQQSEIREMTTALLNLLTPEQQAVGTIARVTHTLLCDLCDKVSEHLVEEHKGVFPELLSHGDQNVQNMVWGFINHDKPLRDLFNSYKHKWLRDCEYPVNNAFIGDTKEMLETLEGRMQMEDSKMIPKLEASGFFANA
jgi:hypothetical protein